MNDSWFTSLMIAISFVKLNISFFIKLVTIPHICGKKVYQIIVNHSSTSIESRASYFFPYVGPKPLDKSYVKERQTAILCFVSPFCGRKKSKENNPI